MDTLEKAALAYFSSDWLLQVEALLYVVGGALAVGLDGGSRRLNRLQFIAAAALIITLSAGTSLVVQAAIPTMVGLPAAPPARAQQSLVSPVVYTMDLLANLAGGGGHAYTLDPPQQQPDARFDPTTAVPEWAQQQPPTNTGANNGWVLMLADLGRVAALGYAMGLVAMARCRDSSDKNQKGHAIAGVVLGAIYPLAYVLLLGKTKAGTPGLDAAQEVPLSAVATPSMIP